METVLTVREALAREEMDLGREVKLLAYKRMPGQVLVLMLRTDNEVDIDVSTKTLVTVRLVVYVGIKPLSSLIVKSWWRD